MTSDQPTTAIDRTWAVVALGGTTLTAGALAADPHVTHPALIAVFVFVGLFGLAVATVGVLGALCSWGGLLD